MQNVLVIPYQIYNHIFDSPENFFPRSRKGKKNETYFFLI